MKKPCSATDPLWYKDAIIYELHVRAFADSNGDGIGDFQGLISKLDYLQNLGVTCLWLLPFFPSPLRDDGYDIADYTAVHPSYGTMEDFTEFLEAAHSRGLQVMIELVINHTSDQHPWFQRARHAPKGSPERELYVWSDTPETYKDARIIFTDTEKSNWTWDEVAGQYYWHRFFSHQPDLNFDNSAVLEEVLSAMRFWLDRGVDAMRMDAIPYLIERDGTSCENLPDTHTVIKAIRAAIDEEYENRLVLAEANQWPVDVRPYFGDGDECHMAFHFPLMPRIYMALRQEDRLPITDIMAQTPEIPANCQWGLFLRNHDELTLEMVTDDERDYMYIAYSADPRMRVNVGIRRRLAPLVDNNRRRIELLNSLLLSFPGTPIMYYGDEIGMGDNIYLGDRNGVRTPMQWNSDRNAGFSRAVPAALYFPVIMDPVWGYQAINVEAQESDPSSLLQWTRNMIALRKLFHVFGRGTLEFLLPENRKVLAYIRDYSFEDGHKETVLCVANLSRFAQPAQLDLAKYAGRQPVEMLGYVPFPVVDETPYAITLAPYSFLWLELQVTAAPAAREETASAQSIGTSVAPEVGPGSSVSSSIASLLAAEPARAAIESELPAYVARQRWFGAKSRSIASVVIQSTAAVPHVEAVLAVIEVRFVEGEPERYQLPLMVKSSTDETPDIIARLHTNAVETVVFDACFDASFRMALLRAIEDEASTAALTTSISRGQWPEGLRAATSRIGSAEQSNTSIVYGDTAILKLFRRLRSGENPDVEVARFLTQVAHYNGSPAHLGDIAWHTDGATAAFLQSFAPNSGDGWKWMAEELTDFYAKVSSRHDLSANDAGIAELAGTQMEAACLIGRRTAEMHIALATSSGDAAFTPEAHTETELDEMRARMMRQLNVALGTLETRLPSLEGEAARKAGVLLEHREHILAKLTALAGDPALFGQRIRIHGDYHLGQLLRSGDDFLIVDFEGEPSRSLAERRAKQTPLKDVAGMLRSFSYAARSALMAAPVEVDEKWAMAWEQSVSHAFRSAYFDTVSSQTGLLPDASQRQSMLSALLLEKAAYELTYELNNRPAWLPLPLDGMIALLQGEG